MKLYLLLEFLTFHGINSMIKVGTVLVYATVKGQLGNLSIKQRWKGPPLNRAFKYR